MYYSSLLFAAILLTDASEADSEVDWHATGEYQRCLADRVLDGFESAHSVVPDDDSSCVVSFLQTSIMLKPTEAPHPEPTITSACVPIALGRSTLVYLTFFIVIVVTILTFALSAPVDSFARMPEELATNSSTCPKLAALDGLRVLFITLVIITHEGSKLGRVGHFVSSTGAAGSLMSFFMILSGFIRVITAKKQSFRHHIARLITRFAPAYYLALALCMILEKEQINITAPIEALFLQGFLTDRLRDCLGILGQDFLFGVSWFVADVFVLVALCPFFDKMLQYMDKWIIKALLLVSFVSVPEFLYMTGHDPLFVGIRALEFLAGMILGQMVKELPDWALKWRVWRHLFDCSCILLLFKLLVLQNGGGFIRLKASNRVLMLVIQIMEGVLCCLLMACNYCETKGGSHGVFSSILGWQPLASLGVYSFGAYIYQGVVAHMWVDLFPAWSQSCLFNSLMIPLVWMFAIWSEKYMEGPIRHHVEARMKGVLVKVPTG